MYRNQAISAFFNQVDLDETLKGDGSGLKVGILEGQTCPNIYAVAENHEAFSPMQIYHQQGGDDAISSDNHANAVASQFTYFDPGDPAFDGIPGAELYVANYDGGGSLFGGGSNCGDPSANGFRSGVEWLLNNDVRLMNRSTFRLAQCNGSDSLSDARYQDQVARAYDIVFTNAAGQSEECPGHETLCASANTVCVGPSHDSTFNYGSPDDYTDDFYPFDLTNFYYRDPSDNLDREEPDVLAPAVSNVITNNNDMNNAEIGTSLSAPIVLSMIGESLQGMSGADWTECRESEVDPSVPDWAGEVEVFVWELL